MRMTVEGESLIFHVQTPREVVSSFYAPVLLNWPDREKVGSPLHCGRALRELMEMPRASRDSRDLSLVSVEEPAVKIWEELKHGFSHDLSGEPFVYKVGERAGNLPLFTKEASAIHEAVEELLQHETTKATVVWSGHPIPCACVTRPLGPGALSASLKVTPADNYFIFQAISKLADKQMKEYRLRQTIEAFKRG